jgi:hypothetical protein
MDKRTLVLLAMFVVLGMSWAHGAAAQQANPAAPRQEEGARANPPLDTGGAALEMARILGLPHNERRDRLHGLFPGIFPGGYEGVEDLAYPDQPATLEKLIVALVRWAGWDTVHYEADLEKVVLPFVSPEGFPYYAPDPTPRSIPYVIVALSHGLLEKQDLPRLRQPIGRLEVEAFANKARGVVRREKSFAPLSLGASGVKQALAKLQSARQLIILQSGFTEHEALAELKNPVLDLSGAGLRLYNRGSSFGGGKQVYFPLGPLDTQFSVGNFVASNNYSHQSQSIHGWVENESPTVNAVGVWATATSKKKDARVWGGFIDTKSSLVKGEDAQLVGLEVDVSNHTEPGAAPHRSKVGIQVVGLGDFPLSNAIEVIGAGNARWFNGILFSAGSIDPTGAAIGLGPGEVARGIDFAHARFSDSAILLGNGAPITLLNREGERSAIFTDDFTPGHLVLRAGEGGVRFTDNRDSANLLHIQPDGDLVTPMGSFQGVLRDVLLLKITVVVLVIVVILQSLLLSRMSRQRRQPS